MIHDYKLNPRLDRSRRQKKLSRRSIAIATTALAGALLVELFVDFGEWGAEAKYTSMATSVGSYPAVSILSLPVPQSENMPAEAQTSAIATAETASDVANDRPALDQPPDNTMLLESPVESPELTVRSVSETVNEPEAIWIEHQINKGDTLAAIFKTRGLSPTLLHNIVNSSPKASELARIRPGQRLRFKVDEHNELLELSLERDRLSSLNIVADDESYALTETRKDVDRRTATAAGTIESSLFVDGQLAGLSDNQIMELAGVFGWDIDFALEIRAGDQFKVVYEKLYVNGEYYDTGHILAAEFVNRGVKYNAVRFETAEGGVAYFDADGHNKRRAFIRTPVKFARISSRFTNRRWHPILKKWRSHKGVDYAAPTGTPVRATGAGRVTFRGRKGGYGRVVIVEHAGKYTTVYGHLSKFARKAAVGKRVKQGQVIGYVGKSGLATGPHLHYEFRVAGAHRNPLRVNLPKSLPLAKKHMADFRAHAAPLLAQLDAIGDNTLVAQAAN